MDPESSRPPVLETEQPLDDEDAGVWRPALVQSNLIDGEPWPAPPPVKSSHPRSIVWPPQYPPGYWQERDARDLARFRLRVDRQHAENARRMDADNAAYEENLRRRLAAEAAALAETDSERDQDGPESPSPGSTPDSPLATPPGETLPRESLLGPRGDAVFEDFRQRLHGVRGQAVPHGYGARYTYRDIVLTKPDGGHCRRGRRMGKAKVGAGRHVGAYYKTCDAASCPRCVIAALELACRGALIAWRDADEVHRSVLDPTRRTARIRELSSTYKDLYLRWPTAGGDVVVYTPGPLDGSEPVPRENLAGRMLADVLDGPLPQRGVVPPTQVPNRARLRQKPNETDAEREERLATTTYARLPRGTRPEDLPQLTAEAGIGAGWEWKHEGPAERKHTGFVKAEPESDVEVEAWKERVLNPLREARQAEDAEYREQRKAVHLARQMGWTD